VALSHALARRDGAGRVDRGRAGGVIEPRDLIKFALRISPSTEGNTAGGVFASRCSHRHLGARRGDCEPSIDVLPILADTYSFDVSSVSRQNGRTRTPSAADRSCAAVSLRELDERLDGRCQRV
jgi:hypothetical protein